MQLLDVGCGPGSITLDLAGAMVAELRAWGERPDSFDCALWCGAVGWVDGDELSAGG